MMVLDTDTTQAPSWFNYKEPEEITYWRTGLLNISDESIPILGVATTEQAAIQLRLIQMSSGRYRHIRTPFEITVSQANAIAIDQGLNKVCVVNEVGQIVEEWSVEA